MSDQSNNSCLSLEPMLTYNAGKGGGGVEGERDGDGEGGGGGGVGGGGREAAGRYDGMSSGSSCPVNRILEGMFKGIVDDISEPIQGCNKDLIGPHT